jgi:hypothetical protein
MVCAGVAVAGNIAQGNYAAAAVAAVGFIPGGKLVASVATKSALGTKLLTKAMNLQARAPVIGFHSKIFGAGKGLLNQAPVRFGWSKGYVNGASSDAVGSTRHHEGASS